MMPDTKMKLGGVGCILWLVSAILGLVAAGMMAAAMMGVGTTPSTLTDITRQMESMAAAMAAGWSTTMVASAISIVGTALVALGCFGLRERFKTQLPMIAGIFAVILVVLNAISLAITASLGPLGVIGGALAASLGGSALPLLGVLLLVGVLGFVCTLVFLILLGVTFVTKRTEIGMGSLPMATGILLILGWIPLVIIPALILLMIVFFRLAKETAAPAAPAPTA